MASSAGIPDIAVRLSAQGVADVVAAFARVRKEGKQTGVETAASLELINGALESLTELLPAISLAVAVEKVVDLGLSAREAAENLGKLSEKTGANIGTLSVLGLVAHDSEIEFEALNGGLVKLAKNQQEASDGSKKQAQAFASLGISLKDLRTLDPGALFVKVAQNLAALPGGAQKAQIAIALFGKTGAELIPMFQALGKDGFGEALEKAKSFGLYLNSDVVASARAAQDALHQFEDIANGIGTQFVAGFAPGFTHVVEAFAHGIGGTGVDAVEKFGEVAGNVFQKLSEMILTDIKDMAAFVRFVTLAVTEYLSLEAHIDGFFDKIDSKISFTKGQRDSAAAHYDADVALQKRAEEMRDSANKNYDGVISRLKQIGQALTLPSKKSSPADIDNDNEDRGAKPRFDQEAAAKTAQARSAYFQSLADNELAILKLKNQLEEAEDKRSYDAGLITLDQYYDRREARIRAEADDELKALQDKQKAIEAEPAATSEQQYKRAQDLAKLQTQITELQMKENGDLAAAEDARSKAKHDAALKELEDTEKLQRASGDRYGAEETALNIELRQYTELLASQGKSVAQIEAAVDAYQRRGQASIAFSLDQESGNAAMNRLSLGVGQIQSQAANGSISNVSAQSQILQLQRDSLGTLSQIGLQMFKNAVASEDPKAIEAANQYNAAIQQIGASLKNVTSAQTYLANQLSTVGISSIENFFTAGISGSKSFSDALGDLANDFEQIVASMISKLLVYYAVLELVGWVSGTDSKLYDNINKQSPFSFSLAGHAGGGWTGDVPTDQVAGVVHGQEFVVKAGPASRYRNFLQAVNDGQTPEIRSTKSMSGTTGYVSSGAAGGDASLSISATSAPPVINITNNSGQPVTQKQSSGPGGQSITDIVIGIATTDVMKNGKLGQAIQTTFGATRQGVRRG